MQHEDQACRIETENAVNLFQFVSGMLAARCDARDEKGLRDGSQ
jgi:hypothetical protein